MGAFRELCRFPEGLGSVLERLLVGVAKRFAVPGRCSALFLGELLLGLLAGPRGLRCQLVEASGDLGRVVHPEDEVRLLALVEEFVLERLAFKLRADDLLDGVELGEVFELMQVQLRPLGRLACLLDACGDCRNFARSSDFALRSSTAFLLACEPTST